MKMLRKIAVAWIFILAAWLPAAAAQAPIQFSSDRFVKQDTSDRAQEQLVAQLNMLTGAGGKFKAGGSAPPAYTGAADVSGWTSPYGCWSLRACTSALRGTPVIDVCSNNFGACTSRVTVNSDASTGMPVLSGIGYSPIYIDKIYAQIGGSGMDLDTTSAFRPVLVTNQLAGQPTLRCDKTQSAGLKSSGTITALSQPFSAAIVFRFTDTGIVWADAAFGVQLLGYIAAGPGNRYQALGSRIDYTGTDNVFESIISVYNGGSSSMRINNSVSSNGDPGSNTPSTSWNICQSSAAAFADGDWFETIIKSGAVSSGDQTSMNTNQHTIGTGW